MTSTKARITITVDADLLALANESVAAGRSPSLSAWASRAFADRIAEERRMKALGEAIAAYEAEFGVITDEELEAQERADRLAAIRVRASRTTRKKATRRSRR